MFAAKSATTLERLGVTHLLSVLSGMSQSKLVERHKIIPLDDIPDVNIIQHFDEAIEFIQDAIGPGKDGVILVHCAMGISRSATMVAAYRELHSLVSIAASDSSCSHEQRQVIDFGSARVHSVACAPHFLTRL